MNRSSCLSVLLVGLSMTTASAAFAAPLATSETSPQPKRVALNAQQGTDTGSSTGAAAPSDPAQTPSTPAVSIGTGTPGTPGNAAPVADTPAQSAAEPAAKPKRRPWAGSALFVQNSMTTNTVFRGQTQYANPTVESSLWFSPRYAINDAFQLRARVIFGYEYTNDDSTTTNHEPTISDTTLQLFYRKIPTLPLGIHAAVALNAGLPTSKLSRSRTLVAAPGATLQLVKGIEHFIGGEATILGSLTYSHPFYRSRNPVVVDDRPPGAVTCVGGSNCDNVLSGTMNPSDTLSYMLLFAPEWGKWNPAVMYLGNSQWVYSPKDVSYNGAPVQSPTGFEPTSVRQTHYVSAWLDYNFNSWLTGEVGFWNSVAAINGAGKRSNVVFDRYQDTRVYLGASIQLDNLVKAIQGGNEGEAGIVRAKNSRTPIMNF